MSFDGAQTTQQISDSIGSMLLLDSSCQALMEATISPSTSPWYEIVDQELGAAENLVVAWRQSGYLYFKSEILTQIQSAGTAFTSSQPTIDALFAQLERNFDPTIQAQIVSALSALQAPVQAMTSALASYTARLAKFEQDMGVPQHQMVESVAQIQAQEADIKHQIDTINAQITQLQQQVVTDRQAIAKAQAQRTTGIIETVFGVLLAPITGGVSLILAGIGVGTIAEAQEKVDALQDTITRSQSTIAADQTNLSDDQQQIATLGGLSASMNIVQSDVGSIDTALDALRTTWTTLLGEITDATADVQKATTATEALLARIWLDAACNSWSSVLDFVNHMNSLTKPTATIIHVG